MACSDYADMYIIRTGRYPPCSRRRPHRARSTLGRPVVWQDGTVVRGAVSPWKHPQRFGRAQLRLNALTQTLRPSAGNLGTDARCGPVRSMIGGRDGSKAGPESLRSENLVRMPWGRVARLSTKE